jgi:DDE domain
MGDDGWIHTRWSKNGAAGAVARHGTAGRRGRWRPAGILAAQGVQHYLWRAVDQDSVVLDILVQDRRDSNAAKRYFGRLLKGLHYVPRVIMTDKLRSYGVAQRHLVPGVEHRESRYLNNRARTRIGRHGGESGRCNGSNHSGKPKTFSPPTRSSMATSIRADTDLRPMPIVRSGPTLSRPGSRRPLPDTQLDRRCTTILGSALPARS